MKTYMGKIINNSSDVKNVVADGSVYLRIQALVKDIFRVQAYKFYDGEFLETASFTTSKKEISNLGPLCFEQKIKHEVEEGLRKDIHAFIREFFEKN